MWRYRKKSLLTGLPRKKYFFAIFFINHAPAKHLFYIYSLSFYLIKCLSTKSWYKSGQCKKTNAIYEYVGTVFCDLIVADLSVTFFSSEVSIFIHFHYFCALNLFQISSWTIFWLRKRNLEIAAKAFSNNRYLIKFTFLKF